MATSKETDGFPSLSESFDIQLKNWMKIDTSELPSNSEDLQKNIASTISKLEELTLHVSYLGVFSDNESIEEISTQSLKFLMLPVLLGALSQKLLKPERQDTLQIALIYFKDFLKRCKNYNLTSSSIIEEKINELVSSKPSANSVPIPEDIKRMGKQREEKIRRYKEKKALCEKLTTLKVAVERNGRDEELLREFYLTMISELIYQSIEEIESINLELDMLWQIKSCPQEPKLQHQKELSKPLRPFLITKDAVQKKVFGAGYPSLPVMSVEEFYEQRVKEGWFPPGRKNDCCAYTETKFTDTPAMNTEEKDDDDEDIGRLRQRDEYRDTHRRGWGNTYNRS